jgi:S1-C subfamily serine protease
MRLAYRKIGAVGKPPRRYFQPRGFPCDGLLIVRLVPDGPAERAGLRGPQEKLVRRGNLVLRGWDRSKADRIVAVDGRAVKTLDDLLSYIESKKPGERMSFHIVREGESYEVPVTLVEARK